MFLEGMFRMSKSGKQMIDEFAILEKKRDYLSLSLWEKIMFINKKYGWNWKYDSLDAMGNDMAGELAEICSDIKVMSGRGTHKKDIPTTQKLAEEYFDLYVYLVIQMESLRITEEEFNKIAIEKLNIIEKRMMENPKK